MSNFHLYPDSSLHTQKNPVCSLGVLMPSADELYDVGIAYIAHASALG